MSYGPSSSPFKKYLLSFLSSLTYLRIKAGGEMVTIRISLRAGETKEKEPLALIFAHSG